MYIYIYVWLTTATVKALNNGTKIDSKYTEEIKMLPVILIFSCSMNVYLKAGFLGEV